MRIQPPPRKCNPMCTHAPHADQRQTTHISATRVALLFAGGDYHRADRLASASAAHGTMTRRYQTNARFCLIAIAILLLSSSFLSCFGSLVGSPSSPSLPPSPRPHEVSIDSVTVLLPAHVHSAYRTFVVYYPVTAHGGCFTWRTSHPGIINIQNIPDSRCTERVAQKNPITGAQEYVTREGFTSVYVSAAASVAPGSEEEQLSGGQPGAPFTSNETFQRRLAAWISAHDIAREDRFAECEIFVDVIDRLEILTSTRRINVGDVEALQLAAYDSMGNVFSSLDGLPFNWINTDSNILDSISVAESGLVVPASVWELERSEIGTNVHPVRGSVPGRVNITATLADPSHPIATQAEFLVIEALFLKPSSARVAPGSEMKIQLLTRFKEERLVRTDRTDELVAETTTGPAIHRREIAMPSVQYKWSSLDASIASVDKDLGVLLARKVGATRIRVGDVNLPEHRRESDIIVVDPASISLELRAVGAGPDAPRRPLCDGSYFVMQGQQVELLIFLLDAHGFRISVTPNMRFEFSTQGSSLVRSKSPDATPTSPLPTDTARATPPSAAPIPSSSTIHLLAASTGVTTIAVSLASIVSGEFVYVLKKDGVDFPLTQTVKVAVTAPIRIESPAPLRLPFVSPSTPKYALHATGGSGRFHWRSASSDVLRVVGDGPVTNTSAATDVQALTPGIASVRAADACNPESFASLEVEVVMPGRPEFILLPTSTSEATTDAASSHHTIDVYVKLAGKPLDDCRHVWLHAGFPLGQGAFNLLDGNTSKPQTIFTCINECPVQQNTNCFHLKLQATKVGMAQLRVNLVDSPSVHGVPLAVAPALRVFSSFAPLVTEPSPLLLAVGSNKLFRHASGPISWSAGGFAEEGHGGRVHLSEAGVIESAAYEGLAETRFTQTWIQHAASGVLDRTELAHAPWLKHDVSGEGFVAITAVDGATPNMFSIKCLRPSDPLAIHVVVTNTKNFQSASNPIRNPLAAHDVIRVHCFPLVALAPEPASIGIGETSHLRLKDPLHPLLNFIRFTADLNAGDKPVVAVNPKTGSVTGLRLGWSRVRAAVDRAALLVDLGYPPHTRQPEYEGDGLQATHRLTVEFDSFQIALSTPTDSTLLRSHSTLASVVGSSETGPSPLDESFENIQCAWTVEHTGTPGLGLAPPLSASFHSAADEPAPVVYGCALRVWALRAGTHTLRVRIVVSQPPKGQQQAAFTHSMTLTVIDPLLLLSPSTLVLPPASTSNILTNIAHTNATGANGQMKYSVMQYTCRAAVDPSHVPLITVDDRGVITVRALKTGEVDSTADAVILVQSLHTATPLIADDATTLPALTQSQVVLVQVRPIAQLSVGSTPAQLLCASRNYTLALSVHDSLGRRFDLPRVDELLTAARADLSATSSSELPVQVVKAPSITVHDQLMAAYALHVGEPSALTLQGDDAQTLHALQDFTLSFSLPSLPSLFLQFYVATSNMCSEPAPVLLSLKLAIGTKTWLSDYPTNSVHRDAFVQTFSSEIASALDLPVDQHARVRVVNVDPASGIVELILMPKSIATTLHKDQWFMAYFTPVHVAGTQATTLQPNEQWLSAPFALAQSLQKQAADRLKQGALWRGSLTQQIDPRSPFSSVELSAHDADRLSRDRRAPSSALSSSAVGASGASVWSDERDFATWSRVHEGESAIDLLTSTSDEDGGDATEASGAAAMSAPPAEEAAARERERERREAEENKWKEQKRRYELEKMRESAPVYSSALIWSVMSACASILAVFLCGAYAYWYTVVAHFAVGGGVGVRRLALPTEQERRTPEHSFLVWIVELIQESIGCARHRQARPAQLIDPQRGPNERDMQQQRNFQQVPPQIYALPQQDDFQHIQHAWNR